MSWTPPSSTSDIVISQDPLERIVGQEAVLRIVRLALRRKAHLLLIGPPGTGKSLVAAAYAHHATRAPAEDVVVRANPERPTQPLIASYPAGEASGALERERRRAGRVSAEKRAVALTGAIVLAAMAWWWSAHGNTAALIACALAAAVCAYAAWRAGGANPQARILVAGTGPAPFVDATGFRESALLGDVRHDPHQSGAGSTAPHELLEPGAIHEAHGGVLFIDEAATLSPETQQRLLSALQNKRLPIIGRNVGSSGTMIRSAPLPCNVAFVLAGLEDEIQTLHAGLRSRMRGYGYEAHMATTMPDTPANRDALVRFVAQELALDPAAPPCHADGLNEIIALAAEMSGRPEALTLLLRDLGGVVRTAADIAFAAGAGAIGAHHVQEAMRLRTSMSRRSAH